MDEITQEGHTLADMQNGSTQAFITDRGLRQAGASKHVTYCEVKVKCWIIWGWYCYPFSWLCDAVYQITDNSAAARRDSHIIWMQLEALRAPKLHQTSAARTFCTEVAVCAQG